MSDNLVSIIMPCFNRERIISRSIESVINQTYNQWELIVVDDGSTDNTNLVVEKYKKVDKRIKYVKCDLNKGPSVARNIGIHNARGEYISFLDSDDEWIDTHLEDSINALNKTGCDICFASWVERTKDGNELFRYVSEVEKEKFNLHIKNLNARKIDNIYVFDRDFIEYTILNNFFIYHINTLVIKTDIVKKIGGFDEKLKCSEDTDFMFELFARYGFCYINQIHFYYNQSENNIYLFINRKNTTIKEIVENKEYLQKMIFCGIEKCKMLKKRIKIIKKSDINEKKQCIKKCKFSISIKYRTLAFLSYPYSRKQAIFYALKSIFYERNDKNYYLLFSYIVNRKIDNIDVALSDLNIA